MQLTIGFSPCPNDTYIFDALVNKKIDTQGLVFKVVLEDVETLNQWALQGKLDITKLSFPTLFQCLKNYSLLDAGTAMGKGVGPLLITAPAKESGDIQKSRIAIPGVHTTANMLLNFAFPQATNKVPMLFSEIEDAIIRGDVDLGVIIHENRFTYQQRGLLKIADLGEYWENETGLPVPLGGIAINRRTSTVAARVEGLIRKSLEYANARNPEITDYVKQHSQTMSEEVMRQHINLYVNEYSLALGKTGREAIEKMFSVYSSMNGMPAGGSSEDLFLGKREQ
jgi:1,4-dihydroxy-6-naphthoate synthase